MRTARSSSIESECCEESDLSSVTPIFGSSYIPLSACRPAVGPKLRHSRTTQQLTRGSGADGHILSSVANGSYKGSFYLWLAYSDPNMNCVCVGYGREWDISWLVRRWLPLIDGFFLDGFGTFTARKLLDILAPLSIVLYLPTVITLVMDTLKISSWMEYI
jgi:hypothetical protein